MDIVPIYMSFVSKLVGHFGQKSIGQLTWTYSLTHSLYCNWESFIAKWEILIKDDTRGRFL